jgi:hypothetical protein
VDGWLGTRDRSWGVRPIGARDAQETVPPVPPQFFWLWGPCNFPSGSFFFHSNDDAAGEPWNRRAVWSPEGVNRQVEIDRLAVDVDWKSGTRHAQRAVVSWEDPSGRSEITYEPEVTFFMQGLGYTHPKWGHGLNHGEFEIEREDLTLADADVRLPHHLHIQALSKVVWKSGRGETQAGRGILEQLVIGPHAPSGFSGLLDFAK